MLDAVVLKNSFLLRRFCSSKFLLSSLQIMMFVRDIEHKTNRTRMDNASDYGSSKFPRIRIKGVSNDL